MTDRVAQAVDVVANKLGTHMPRAAIVLGSGLGFLGEEVERAVRIPYAQIPGFPQPTVEGHKGELIAGTLEGVPVLVQSGRFHLYEGHSAETAALPVRVFGRLGVRTVILTNAAGGIRATFQAGTLMLIADHMNLMFRNPLIGPALAGEERFPDMSDPYDPGLRETARAVARERQVALEEGVYCALLGPSYETPAKIRMLQRLGADAVGMSTVPEVIVARASGIRCLGFSIITNPAAGLSAAPVSHQEVLAVGRVAGARLGTVIRGVVGRL